MLYMLVLYTDGVPQERLTTRGSMMGCTYRAIMHLRCPAFVTAYASTLDLHPQCSADQEFQDPFTTCFRCHAERERASKAGSLHAMSAEQPAQPRTHAEPGCHVKASPLSNCPPARNMACTCAIGSASSLYQPTCRLAAGPGCHSAGTADATPSPCSPPHACQGSPNRLGAPHRPCCRGGQHRSSTPAPAARPDVCQARILLSERLERFVCCALVLLMQPLQRAPRPAHPTSAPSQTPRSDARRGCRWRASPAAAAAAAARPTSPCCQDAVVVAAIARAAAGAAAHGPRRRDRVGWLGRGQRGLPSAAARVAVLEGGGRYAAHALPSAHAKWQCRLPLRRCRVLRGDNSVKLRQTRRLGYACTSTCQRRTHRRSSATCMPGQTQEGSSLALQTSEPCTHVRGAIC